MKLNFLGIGSCFNTILNNTSAFFFLDEEKTEMCLINLISRVTAKLKRLPELNSVKHMHIFITHLHDGHVGALPALLSYLITKGIKFSIHVGQKNHYTLRRFLTRIGVDAISPVYKMNFVVYEDTIAENMFTQKSPLIETSFGVGFNMIRAKYDAGVGNYMVLIYTKDELIVYTGGCSHSNYLGNDIFEKNNGKRIRIYTDCSNEESVFNYSLDQLQHMYEEHYRQSVFCMHFDSTKTKKKALELGFNVTEHYNIFNN